MFDHVISSLSPEFAAEVRDLLLRPPTDNPLQHTQGSCFYPEETTTAHQRRGTRQLLRRTQQLLGDQLGADADTLTNVVW